MQEINFDIQKLTIKSEIWKVDLIYLSSDLSHKIIANQAYDYKIDICNVSKSTSRIVLNCSKNGKSYKKCMITGIDGGCYFHLSTEKDNSQSVKLVENELVLSLGFSFASINLDKMQLNWIIRPDLAEIFEFYDLEDDFLLRGELQIHRVDKNGTVKWSYGGRDIWVNIDGEKEVTIYNDSIELIDFNSDRYLIDYNGKTLES